MNIFLNETNDLIKHYFKEKLDSIYIEKAVLGLFFSGVKISTGQGGLCFTPVKEIPEAVCCPSSAKAMPLSGKLKGKKVTDMLKDLNHSNILRKTLAICTLNALSTLYWQKNENLPYSIKIGVDAFDEVKIPENGNAVVVGALVPIIKKLLISNCNFKILEMDSRTLKGKELEHFIPANKYKEYMPNADLAVITGTTILNDSLENLLLNKKENAQIIVTGPTASMLPDIFFKKGVTILGGIIVTKPDEVLEIISEGGSGYHFFGKSAERIVINKN